MPGPGVVCVDKRWQKNPRTPAIYRNPPKRPRLKKKADGVQGETARRVRGRRGRRIRRLPPPPPLPHAGQEGQVRQQAGRQGQPAQTAELGSWAITINSELGTFGIF